MTYNRDTNASNMAKKKCNNKCVICGWKLRNLDGESMVEGCHIKPFKNNKEDDVLENIIALCPNHHTEFDNYCYYIETNTHTLRHYDRTYEFNGTKLDIEYVEESYLAYRQYLVTKYWDSRKKSD